MRTVSFSNREVHRLLDRFVCLTTNIEGDPASGASLAHSPKDAPGQCIRGNGRQNVQTIFMTPQGEIFHVATGYIGPDELAAEITFARELFARITQASPSDDVAQMVATTHAEWLRRQGFDADEIRSGRASMFDPRGMNLFNGVNVARDMFGRITRNEVLKDHKYMIDHPMVSMGQFERSPETLVGSGKSFFGSVSGGTRGGRIGQ